MVDLSPSPRAARTRAALIGAGMDILAARPIDGVSIDEIVAGAQVGKGSFFNHFTDKRAFAAAIALAVRSEIENRVDAANRDLTDPIARLARGMRIAADFAIEDRQRALVMLRTLGDVRGHPLDRGVARDITAAVTSGKARSGAARRGVAYWLGLCHALMTVIADAPGDLSLAHDALVDMLTMGLTGLGVSDAQAEALAQQEASISRCSAVLVPADDAV